MEVASNRPRFRTDLVAECIEAEGQRFIDVIDPDTGDAFRFYEVEYSLACAMDGERDLASLASWAREELGIEPSQQELRTVITTLGELGYLEAQPVSQAAAEVAAASARGMDDELGLSPGVHAAPREVAPPSGVDVALGAPGGERFGGDEPMVAAEQVDLGHAVPQPSTPAVRVGMESVDDVELGTSGGAPEPVVPSIRRQTVPAVHEYSDEPTNLPAPHVGDFDDEVSVDLSEHLAIGRDDVKEAVRMSRSMKAVDVPKELLEELGEKEAAIAERAQAAKDAALAARSEGSPSERTDGSQAEMVVEADEPTPPPREMPIEKPTERVAAMADKPPVELPSRQVHVATRDRAVDKAPEKAPEKVADKSPHERPIADAKPSGGTSPVLIILLVLVILAGGGFLVWKYVLNKPKSDTETSQPTPATGSATATGTAVASATGAATASATGTAVATGSATATATGTAAATGAATGTGTTPAPEPITATLAAGPEAGGVPITSEKGGVVLFVVSDGATVNAGEVVAKFNGVAAIEKKLGDKTAGLVWDIEVRVPKEIEKYTKARDKATAEGNAAAAKAQDKLAKERTKRLEEKKAEADELRAKIAALTVTAPAAGKITAPVARGKRVAAGGTVATLAGAPTLIATFDVSKGTKKDYAVDQPIAVAAQETPDQPVNCSVTAVEGANVSVSCAADSGLAVGTVVVLAP